MLQSALFQQQKEGGGGRFELKEYIPIQILPIFSDVKQKYSLDTSSRYQTHFV